MTVADVQPRPIDALISVSAEFYCCSLSDFYSGKRTEECVSARHAAAYLARDLLKMTFPKIGRSFCQDHTTIMHACERIDRLLPEFPKLRTELATIKSRYERVTA